MRSSMFPRLRAKVATAAALLSFSSLIQPAFATPFPKDALHDTLDTGFLQDPLCASYCGAENEHCCSTGEVCTTADGVAACAVVMTVATRLEIATIYPRQDDSWSLYTSTYTITSTYTTTGSARWGASPTSAGASTGTCVPQEAGETECGPICCASNQVCAYDGQCTAAAGGDAITTAWSTYPTTITTAGSTITTQFSAPYRVTGTGATTTNTGTIESATTTGSGNGTAAASGTGGSTLSGGAIAGIVIGVLAGILILLAICACCIMRGLWHGLLALLGLGPKKKRSSSRDRETVIVEEERYSRRGSNPSHAARNSHGSWFARNPARSAAGESRRTSEKVKSKDEGTSWWGAGALGTLLLLLGLRRDKKRRSSAAARRPSRPRSAVSSSYFASYTASSPSEFSSDYTYSSVYTPVQSQHPRRASLGPSVVRSPVRTQSVARSASRGAGGGDRVYRDEYDPMTKPPPDYAGSASSGGRTRDTRRSRRTETTRMSRAQSRR